MLTHTPDFLNQDAVTSNVTDAVILLSALIQYPLVIDSLESHNKSLGRGNLEGEPAGLELALRPANPFPFWVVIILQLKLARVNREPKSKLMPSFALEHDQCMLNQHEDPHYQQTCVHSGVLDPLKPLPAQCSLLIIQLNCFGQQHQPVRAHLTNSFPEQFN